MGKGLMKLITVGAALAVAAVPASGSVGSIISSFKVNVYYPPEMTLGVYRDAEYVYIVTYDYGGNFYLIRCEPDGTRRGNINLGYYPHGPLPPNGADHSVVGTGFISFPWGYSGLLTTNSTSTGYLVKSEKRRPYFDEYAFIPGGQYIYTSQDRVVYRFTMSWTLVNSFTISRGSVHAATAYFNGHEGEYIIVEAGYPNFAYVYTGAGSFVTSFPVIHSGKDTVCGPGYPSSYGTTYWRFIKTAPNYGWCYQIDLGATSAITPASVGRIKALYR